MNNSLKTILLGGWLLPVGLIIGAKFGGQPETVPAVPQIPETSDLTEMSEPERDSFRDEVRAYLLDSPEVLMEAIQVLERRQQDQQLVDDAALVAMNSDQIFNDGVSWVGGNPEGDITMVEFLDYRCGYCRKAHDQVAELIESDGNIRLIVKEFPILGEQSTISARLAIATLQVAGPDGYKVLNDALMRFNGDLNDNTSRNILNGLDLDSDAILAQMSDASVTEHIGKVSALAKELKITGTPTFVIQQELVRGYVPLDGMREMIASLREQAN